MAARLSQKAIFESTSVSEFLSKAVNLVILH